MKKVLIMLEFFKNRLVWAIPIFMILGLLYGLVFDPKDLKLFIVPLTFLMVYPMMVTLNVKQLFSAVKDTKLQALTLIINFAIIPFIAFGMGRIFFSDKPMLALGLLLAALLPTSGMTISWTGFAKGNLNAAIKMTVVGLLVGSLATPIYIKALMGTAISIPIFNIFKQIMFIVFLPMLAGFITQKFLIKKFGDQKYQEKIKPKFPLLSTLGVLGIVFVAMALKARTIIENPMFLLSLLLPLILFYGINFVFSTVIGKIFLVREDAIALLYGTVMRNLSIALAIAMLAFGKQGSTIALIIALAYIIQVQSAAWYVKFTHKIF